jgi:5'-3' exonuclease
VYKGNRKKTEKPKFFQHMRTYISVNYDTTISVDEEADDLIAMAAHKANYNACVVSTDKDFKQLPCWHQNPTTNVLSLQSTDDAITYFYTQMLTGDTVDNIKGVMGIGPVKAAKLLEGHEGDAKAMYKVVLDAYEGDVDRVLENGRLLHLRRTEGEMWEPPV